MFRFALLLSIYTLVALAMCAFIMANDNSESFGTPSPISEVKSTQRGSVVEYIIYGLAFLFIILCIGLNRSSKSSVIGQLLNTENITTKSDTNTASDNKQPQPEMNIPVVSLENNEVHADFGHTDPVGAIIKPIIDNAGHTEKNIA
jgi:preprotein translocase subunit SecG